MTKKVLTGLDLNGPVLLSSSAGTSGQALISGGAGTTPTWGNATSGNLIQSLTAPTSPTAGTTWFKTDTGQTFTWYTDGSSNQWVEMGAPAVVDTSAFSNVAGKNVIINGAFDFWQRFGSGVSSTTTMGTGNYSSADRWKLSMTGNPFTINRGTFTPGSAPAAGYESQYYYNVTLNGNHQNGELQQNVEDARTFAGQVVTLSFWARSTAGAQAMSVGVWQNFGTGGSPSSLNGVWSSTYTPTSSWVRYTFTFTMSSVAGKTFGTNNDSYLWVRVGGFTATTTNTSFDVWGVQLEAGPAATQFSRAAGTTQGELSACQRYFQILTSGAPDFNMPCVRESSGQVVVTWQLPVTMRATPSLWFSATSQYGRVVMRNQSFTVAAQNCTGLSLYTPPNFNQVVMQALHPTIGGDYIYAEWDTNTPNSSTTIMGVTADL